MEYVLIHRGQRGQSYEYELLHDGRADAGPHLSGLIDIETLKTSPTTASSRGQGQEFTGPSRPHLAPIAAPDRSVQNRVKPQPADDYTEPDSLTSESRGTPTSTVLRDAPRLAAQYGGEESAWAKISSSVYKAADGFIVETHAYMNTITKEIVELKSKFGN